MKTVRNFLILAFAFLSFSLVTVNAQSYSTAGSTQSIERQVYKKILGLPRYEVFDHIQFQVSGDTVTLSGKVYNGINKSSAESVVKRVAGVSHVVNNIEVLPPSPFDDRIRVGVLQSIANTGGLSRYFWEVNPAVRIIVDNGHVSLEGFVANKGDYNLMNILANGVPNVFSVENNLVIDNGKAN